MTDATRIDILEKRLDEMNKRLATIEDTQEGLVEVIKDILWKRIRRRANVVAGIVLVLLWAILYATGLFEIFFDYLFALFGR